MNKAKIPLAIILVIIVALFINQTDTKPSDGLNVGIIAPLSGDLAYFGNDFMEGAQLASENINAAGGKMTLHIEDDQFNPAQSVSAYQKINATAKLDAVVTFGNAADEVVLPLAIANDQVLFSTFSTASGFPAKDELAFRYFTNADTDAPIMAKYAFDQVGSRKVAVLNVQDSFGIDYAKIFSDKFTELGGSITGTEQITYTEYDYRTQLTKLLARQPDSIYLIGQDFQILIAAQQLKNLNFKGRLLTVGTIATQMSIEKSKGTLEGAYATAFCTDSTPKDFVIIFEKRYNKKPGFMAELGYDMIRILAESSDDGSINDAKKISNNMLEIKNYQTNQGLVSSDQYGEIIIPMCPKQIRNGKIFNLTTQQYSNY